ncbi:hypothetical protein BH23CHL4_BH23CHL4_16310 [soil metagenome]
MSICLPESIEIDVQKAGSHANHFTMFGSPDLLFSLVAEDFTLIKGCAMTSSYELINLVSGNLADVYQRSNKH